LFDQHFRDPRRPTRSRPVGIAAPVGPHADPPTYLFRCETSCGRRGGEEDVERALLALFIPFAMHDAELRARSDRLAR
jgi:hypothetical protein